MPPRAAIKAVTSRTAAVEVGFVAVQLVVNAVELLAEVSDARPVGTIRIHSARVTQSARVAVPATIDAGLTVVLRVVVAVLGVSLELDLGDSAGDGRAERGPGGEPQPEPRTTLTNHHPSPRSELGQQCACIDSCPTRPELQASRDFGGFPVFIR